MSKILLCSLIVAGSALWYLEHTIRFETYSADRLHESTKNHLGKLHCWIQIEQ